MLASRGARISAGISLFLFVFLVTFPFRNLRGTIFTKIYAATGIALSSEDLSLTFFGWPGVILKNATAVVPAPGGEVEISAERVVVRVGVGGIFPPAPSISLSFTKLKGGGDLYVRVVPSRTRIKGSIESTAVALPQFPISGIIRSLAPAFAPEGPFLGSIDVDGDFSVDLTDNTKTYVDASLAAKGLVIPSIKWLTFTLPPMKLGEFRLNTNTKNGAIEIANMKLGGKGADLSGTGTGELKLGQPFAESDLNLTLRLELTEAYRSSPNSETVRAALGVYETEPGRYGMRWKKKLATMQTNLMESFPEKAP